MTNRLHIAIDGHRLITEPKSSMASYLRALIRGWTSSADPPRISVFVPNGSELPPDCILEPGVVEVYATTMRCDPAQSYRYQVYWQQIVIPRLTARCKPDVYLSPFHLTPLFSSGTPVVTTIHDLCFLDYPIISMGSIVHRMELFSALIHSRRIICVSNSTLRYLSRHSSSAAKRARVVHNGANVELISSEEAIPRIRALGLSPREYFLWAGTPAPYKNVGLLINAFAEYQRLHPPKKLAIVAPESAHPMFRQLAQQLGISTDDLKLLAPVDQSILRALYCFAIALVFPSSCEGFGYPTLEAAGQGCPTVAYSRTPAAEILDDVVPLADELSAESFVPLMNKQAVMSESERALQSTRLRERASIFSCERMATETLSVLAEAATGSNDYR